MVELRFLRGRRAGTGLKGTQCQGALWKGLPPLMSVDPGVLVGSALVAATRATPAKLPTADAVPAADAVAGPATTPARGALALPLTTVAPLAVPVAAARAAPTRLPVANAVPVAPPAAAPALTPARAALALPLMTVPPPLAGWLNKSSNDMVQAYQIFLWARHHCGPLQLREG